jgi:hypothetical protein
MYFITFIILFIYLKLMSNYFFKIKLFKFCDIDVWVIMHIDTFFLKLEYFNYDDVKLLKNSFPN